jgi:hypothetical protein
MSCDRRMSVMAQFVVDLVLQTIAEWLALVFFRWKKKEPE